MGQDSAATAPEDTPESRPITQDAVEGMKPEPKALDVEDEPKLKPEGAVDRAPDTAPPQAAVDKTQRPKNALRKLIDWLKHPTAPWR